MYVLRIAPLKAQLARNGLTEAERRSYLLAWMMLLSLATTLPRPEYPGWFVAFDLLVTGAGVLWAYARNGGAAGSQLLERYVSLSWVIAIRVLLVLGALHVVLGFLGDAAHALAAFTGYALSGLAGMDDDGTGGQSLDLLLASLANAWIAWSVGRHVGHVRRMAEGGEPAAPETLPALPTPPAAPRALDQMVERVIAVESGVGAPAAAPAGRGTGRRATGRITVLRSRSSETPRKPARDRTDPDRRRP
jgi:hypothetical protein